MANDSISLSDLQARMKAAEAEYLHAEESVRKAVEQRDRLRTALQVFEEMLGAAASRAAREADRDPPTAPVAAVAPPPPPQVSLRPGSKRRPRRSSPKKTRRAPTAGERAIEELEARGAFLTTHELLDILIPKGFKPNPKAKPYDALYGLLWHASRKSGSRLVNHELKWGLREWLQPEGKASGQEVP